MAIEQDLVGESSESFSAHLKRVEERRSLLKAELQAHLSGESSIVLEIGCGHGHWLTDFAAMNEESFCVGIDLIGNRIDRANRKASRAGLGNVLFLKAEASELLDQMPSGIGIQSVFILFPDPWPKKRHWKNRIMNRSFLDRLSDRCLGNARLHFRTDHSEYFEWVSSLVAAMEKWKPTDGIPWPFERETVFQSKADSYQSLILEKR